MNESVISWTIFIFGVGGFSVICYFVEIVSEALNTFKAVKGRTGFILWGIETLFWSAIGVAMLLMVLYVWNEGRLKWI